MKKIAIILLFISLAGVLSGCTTSTEGKAYYFDEAGNMSATKPKLKIAENWQFIIFTARPAVISAKPWAGWWLI